MKDGDILSNRILVVTSCTGEKLHKPDNQLVLDDFKYIEKLVKRERELAAYQERADKMYTGSQHLALMKGITEYRQHGGEIDLCIISAGYGLLNEDARIVPYEVTFNTMDGQSIKMVSPIGNYTETSGKSSRLRSHFLLAR